MTPFSRAFPVELLVENTLQNNRWFADMLQLWQPSGNAVQRSSEGTDYGLRLAIRDNYLNFYRGGQAIAKVSFSNGALKATIHSKYVLGDAAPNAQTHATLSSLGVLLHGSDQYQQYGGIHDLYQWISNANNFRGKEKQFVDVVASQNPNVVDLEMALPAYNDRKNAPRMDLVNLERNGNHWKIVFWEAKRIDDARARSNGPVPEVVTQVRQYTDWLSDAARRHSVSAAYHNACKLMLSLREIGLNLNAKIPPLGSGIQSIAIAEIPPIVDIEPRILIDATNGDGVFVSNGHLAKLQDHGLQVQIIRAGESMALLSNTTNSLD